MRNSILIIILIIGWLNIHAQNQLSLSDAIRIGLEKNYDIKIVHNSEKIAGINNTWGNTGVMPNLKFTMTGRESYNLNDNEDYRSETVSPDLSLNWVIFNGFSAIITKQKFEELEKQSQGNTAIIVEATIQNIISAYNNCLVQQALIKVYKELSDLSEDRYNLALESKNIGAGTTYESLQAKTSWLEDKTNYLMQKNTFDNAIQALNMLLATEDNITWEFTTEISTETPDYTLDNLVAKLLQNNNTLKNQYIYQSLLKKETALAKSEYFPSLSLNTGVNHTNSRNYYSGTTPDITQNYYNPYVGVTLSWSLYSGGTRKRSVEIAKISEESAQIQVNQMQHSLKNQLSQMFNNYLVFKEILILANEKEETAKLNLELSAEKLKNGAINSFNYRDVQISYMNAAIARLRAMYDLDQSNTDLLRITGGIIDEYK